MRVFEGFDRRSVLFGGVAIGASGPRRINRTLRLIHYAAWLAQRWDDPAFKRAFPWFNTQRYWQDRVLELREQIALMDEPPGSLNPRETT